MNVRTVMTAVVASSLVSAWLVGMTVADSHMAPAQAAAYTTIKDAPTGPATDVAVGADGSTYVVGNFASVGASTGGFAKVTLTTGLVDRSWPSISGAVFASAPDGSGGAYIGGFFTHVDGQPRQGLARILRDGTLDPTWAPDTSPGSTVLALLKVGNTVYIGGEFSQVGGQPRSNVAAIDAVTGSVLPWAPNANSGVKAIAQGELGLFIGGSFAAVNGIARQGVAAIDPTSGATLSWAPQTDGTVAALVLRGGLLYVGGQFATIGGASRNNLAALNATSLDDSSATSWNPNVDQLVSAIDIDDTTAYIGGNFTGVSGVTQNYAAAISTVGAGSLLPWNPNPNGQVTSLAVTTERAYLAGDFTTVGGAAQRYIAEVDKATGAPTGWNPSVSGQVRSILLVADSLLSGGFFEFANVVSRPYAAAFDSFGRVTAWDPRLSSSATAIALSGTTAYIGGGFSTVNGNVPRTRVAAFNLGDGTATGWSPTVDGSVFDIAVDGSTVYLVGAFTVLNGETRNRAASVDAITGTSRLWNPDSNDDTLAYLGGSFTTVLGAPRPYAAAVSTDDTGTLTGWSPNASGTVRDIEVSGNTVYLAGEFSTVNGAPRPYFAAVDDSTATPTSWAPNVQCTVACTASWLGVGRAIQVSGDRVYLGGRFTSVNGTSTPMGLAAVSAVGSGVLDSEWIAEARSPRSLVASLQLSGSRLAVAGNFITPVLGGASCSSNATMVPALLAAPAAPTGVTSTAGNSSASIAWTPGSDGGSPVTRVEFALDDTTTVDDSTTNVASPHTLAGLTNGRTYTVYVRLVNAVAPGPWSVASAPFTPTAPPMPTPVPIPLLPPGAPTQVTATAASASASVTWSPPSSSESYPVSGYTVTASPGSRTCTASGTICTVTGLTNGTTYTFTVVAANAAGSGPASAPSNAVTPRGVPGPPTNVTATPELRGARVTWSPPADDGGSRITDYVVSTSPADAGCATDGTTTCTLTGLKAGTRYTVTVRALNSQGESTPSTSVSVTPRGEPRILITGTRDGNRIQVKGTVTDSDIIRVRPRYRLDGQTRFRTADVAPPVSNGRFIWQRVATRDIAVYVVAQGLISNRVVIRAD